MFNAFHALLLGYASSVIQFELGWRMEGGNLNPPCWPRIYHGFGAIQGILEKTAMEPARHRVLVPLIYRVLTGSTKASVNGFIYAYELVRVLLNAASFYLAHTLWGLPGVIFLFALWTLIVQYDYVENQMEYMLALLTYSLMGSTFVIIPAILWALTRESSIFGLAALGALDWHMFLLAGMALGIYLLLRKLRGRAPSTGLPLHKFMREVDKKLDFGCIGSNLASIKFCLSRKQYSESAEITSYPVPSIVVGGPAKQNFVWFYNVIWSWMGITAFGLYTCFTMPFVGIAIVSVSLIFAVTSRVPVEPRLFSCILPLLMKAAL